MYFCEEDFYLGSNFAPKKIILTTLVYNIKVVLKFQICFLE